MRHTFSKKQKIVALLIAISIPATIYLARETLQRQFFRTKAGPGNADLSISPAQVTKSAGVSDTIDVFINPGGEQVSGIELVIDFDENIINVTAVAPGPFFTDEAPTVGQPLEIIKNISNGRIYYALAFPLGSNYFSTTAASAITINYTTLATGTANLDFVVTGQPATTISDVNAQNVLGNTFLGTITVSQGPKLYFSDPIPLNPQKVGTNFDVMVYADTDGQDIDGVDARIIFDTAALQVVDVAPGTAGEFISFPSLDFDNTSGKVSISANIGSAGTAIPANGASLHVGTITFNPISESAGTLVTFDFAPGGRNDSNIVLSGTLQNQDPTDILAAVTNTNIVIGAAQTPTPTPTGTPTPTSTATATPTIIATPTPSPTPTSPPASTVTVKLTFQGKIRTGIDLASQVAVKIKSTIGALVLDQTFDTSSNGEFLISIQPGDYFILIKAPGYLARGYGNIQNPIGITEGQISIDLSNNPLIGGDFNADGIINEVDYTLNFLPAFQTNNPVVDLDGSGEVNNLDFGVMRSNWNLVDDVI